MKNLYKYELKQTLIGEYDETNLPVSTMNQLELHKEPDEAMWMIAIDNNIAVKGVIKIASGDQNSIKINLHSVARDIVMMNPKHIIIIHNHPSGESRQSDEDVFATKRISETANVLGVVLTGSYICFGENKYTEVKYETK